MRIKANTRLIHGDNSFTLAGEEATVTKEIGAILIEKGHASEVKAESATKKKAEETKEESK